MNTSSERSAAPLLADETRNRPTPAVRSWLADVRLVSLLTVVSRLLGLIRDIGMAALFGNGILLDAFTLAFRIPNLSRRLFGEGALTTAFLPQYVRACQQQDRRSAMRLATAVLICLSALLVAGVLIIELTMWMMYHFGGLSPNSELIVWMTGWMLPYVVLICLSAQFAAILHAERRFGVPALVPIVLNVVWITAIWGVAAQFSEPHTQMQAMLGAVLIGGFGQFVLPLWALLRSGFQFQADWWQQRSGAFAVFHLMLPIVLGLSVSQINAIADSTLAWWYSQPQQGGKVAVGTAAALYFGQRLYQFPLGVFGIALGTVLFARLSEHKHSGNTRQINEDVNLGVRLILLVGLPATAGLMLLAFPLTATLFERGAFDAADTQQTAAIVIAYGSGVWAFLGISLVQRVFYAIGDVRSPVQIGLLAVVLNLILNFVLLEWLGGPGLAYASAISAMVQLGLLIGLLNIRLKLQFGAAIGLFLVKLLAATAVMSAVCWLVLSMNAGVSRWGQLGLLLATILAAIATYVIVLKILAVNELHALIGPLLKRPRPPIAPESETAKSID